MTLLSTGTDYDALAAAFRPIFTRIAGALRSANNSAFCPMSRSAG